MRSARWVLALWIGSFFLTGVRSQSPVEGRVLSTLRELARQGQMIQFSELYNSPRFDDEEKAFLGRLYEIFFQIPALLKQDFEQNGSILSRRELAARLGISTASVDLLLQLMEKDPRVPRLFDRDPASGELAGLDLSNIEIFLSQASQVRVTNWEGEPMPSFQVETLTGEPLSSEQLKGNNLLIYFWFTGCPPCVRISPHLVALDQRYRSRGFQIIGFNADRILGLETTDEQRLAYLKKQQVAFLNAHLDAPTRRAFGSVNIFPTLFFVNREGTIVRHFINYQDLETLEGIVKELVGG